MWAYPFCLLVYSICPFVILWNKRFYLILCKNITIWHINCTTACQTNIVIYFFQTSYLNNLLVIGWKILVKTWGIAQLFINLIWTVNTNISRLYKFCYIHKFKLNLQWNNERGVTIGVYSKNWSALHKKCFDLNLSLAKCLYPNSLFIL